MATSFTARRDPSRIGGAPRGARDRRPRRRCRLDGAAVLGGRGAACAGPGSRGRRPGVAVVRAGAGDPRLRGRARAGGRARWRRPVLRRPRPSWAAPRPLTARRSGAVLVVGVAAALESARSWRCEVEAERAGRPAGRRRGNRRRGGGHRRGRSRRRRWRRWRAGRRGRVAVVLPARGGAGAAARGRWRELAAARPGWLGRRARRCRWWSAATRLERAASLASAAAARRGGGGVRVAEPGQAGAAGRPRRGWGDACSWAAEALPCSRPTCEAPRWTRPWETTRRWRSRWRSATCGCRCARCSSCGTGQVLGPRNAAGERGRAAGSATRVVARGELVDVDGELGVRVLSMNPPPGATDGDPT